jgi:hypothetical protein
MGLDLFQTGEFMSTDGANKDTGRDGRGGFLQPVAEIIPREPVATPPTSSPAFFKKALLEMSLEILPSSGINILRLLRLILILEGLK